MEVKPITRQILFSAAPDNIKSTNENIRTDNKSNPVTVQSPYSSIPLSTYSVLVQRFPNLNGAINSKGSSFQVANQLKQLNGSLDEKILKAKDIILKDLGIPPEAVVCENRDCGAGAYAATSIAEGKIYYNKDFCKSPNSQFSDEAVLCILRHELDHLIVSAKLYKAMGGEKYEQLMQEDDLKRVLPPNMRKVNHAIFQKLIPYVDTEGFEAQKYIDALRNYNKDVDETGIEYSNYRKFSMIMGNFDNDFEACARNAQFELEQKMGVTTLKDFYSMIDATKEMSALLQKVKDGSSDYSSKDNFVEIMFDWLFEKSKDELGLEDLPKNWGKIIKNSQKYLSNINDSEVIKAYEYRDNKLKKQ